MDHRLSNNQPAGHGAEHIGSLRRTLRHQIAQADMGLKALAHNLLPQAQAVRAGPRLDDVDVDRHHIQAHGAGQDHTSAHVHQHLQTALLQFKSTTQSMELYLAQLAAEFDPPQHAHPHDHQAHMHGAHLHDVHASRSTSASTSLLQLRGRTSTADAALVIAGNHASASTRMTQSTDRVHSRTSMFPPCFMKINNWLGKCSFGKPGAVPLPPTSLPPMTLGEREE